MSICQNESWQHNKVDLWERRLKLYIYNYNKSCHDQTIMDAAIYAQDTVSQYCWKIAGLLQIYYKIVFKKLHINIVFSHEMNN